MDLRFCTVFSLGLSEIDLANIHESHAFIDVFLSKLNNVKDFSLEIENCNLNDEKFQILTKKIAKINGVSKFKMNASKLVLISSSNQLESSLDGFKTLTKQLKKLSEFEMLLDENKLKKKSFEGLSKLIGELKELSNIKISLKK